MKYLIRIITCYFKTSYYIFLVFFLSFFVIVYHRNGMANSDFVLEEFSETIISLLKNGECEAAWGYAWGQRRIRNSVSYRTLSVLSYQEIVPSELKRKYDVTFLLSILSVKYERLPSFEVPMLNYSPEGSYDKRLSNLNFFSGEIIKNSIYKNFNNINFQVFSACEKKFHSYRPCIDHLVKSQNINLENFDRDVTSLMRIGWSATCTNRGALDNFLTIF